MNEATGNDKNGSEEKSSKRRAGKSSVKSSERMQILHKDAVLRLQGLRSAAKSSARAYLANVEHAILEIIDGVNDGVAKKQTIKPSVLEQIIEILDATSLKPEKGRRKDLKHIDHALEAIERLLAKGK